MINKKFPNVPKDLLDELETRFPDQMPDLNMSDADIKIAQGKVAVIRFLRNQFDMQNKTILEN